MEVEGVQDQCRLSHCSQNLHKFYSVMASASLANVHTRLTQVCIHFSLEVLPIIPALQGFKPNNTTLNLNHGFDPRG